MPRMEEADKAPLCSSPDPLQSAAQNGPNSSGGPLSPLPMQFHIGRFIKKGRRVLYTYISWTLSEAFLRDFAIYPSMKNLELDTSLAFGAQVGH